MIDPTSFQSKNQIKGFPANTLTNPKTNNVQLRSGDLLLSRGNAFSSASIARMADTDTQFSHLALFYINPKTNKKYVLESHIEIGSVATPFEEYFKDGKVRSVIYRYPDSKLAERAAQIMYDKITKASQSGNNIPYDFHLDMNDHSELFCSELIRQGFEEASKGSVMLPMFPSRFSMKNRNLLQRLGSDREISFIPADIEGDPRIQYIGEWRSFMQIRAAFRYDAIMSKLYEWMEKYGYTIQDNFRAKVIKNFVYELRHDYLFGGLLKKKLPLNMSKDILSTMYDLQQITNDLSERLIRFEGIYNQKHSLPMTITDMENVLDRIQKIEPNFSPYFVLPN